MAKNTSISLGGHFEEFIEQAISSGKYNSASEVIRSALRLLELQEQKTKSLIKALEEGEDTEMISNFSPEEHLRKLKSNE